jgi:hypothetical protein
MEDLEKQDLAQLVAYYRQKCNELEYSLLISQIKLNKTVKEKEDINQTLL